MDDRTRRTFTFFLFMVLGPILTATLCGAIAVRRLPLSVSSEENALRRQIGCDVKIETVEFQRWNAKKYTNCTLTPPGADGPVFTFPELNVLSYSKSTPGTKSIWEAIFPFLSKSETYYRITAPELLIELDSETKYAQVERLARDFVERFRNRNLASGPDVFFEIEKVQIRIADVNPKDQFEFTFFEGTYSPWDERFPLQCKFSLHDQPGAEPVALTVERFIKDGKHDLQIQFKTVRTPIPVRFLALLFPSLEVLGHDAFFHGTVRGQSNGVQQWALSFEDMGVEKIEFAPLVRYFTPYPMRGTARFGIFSSKLVTTRGSTRFVEADGWLLVENGTIDRRLLENLVKDRYFNLTYHGSVDPLTLDPDKAVLPLRGCVFYFHLANGKATITPRMTDHEPDPFLVLDQDDFFKYYLSENMSGRSIPYSLLLPPFATPDAKKASVPLTPQIQNLLKHIRL